MGKTSSVARGQTGWLLVLVSLGAILRVILAARSPTPYGYVFDFYHEAIQRLYALGHLPASTDCWQCYHPPLHVWLGVPLYAIGKVLADGSDGLADPALRFVAILSLVCGSVSAFDQTALIFWAPLMAAHSLVATIPRKLPSRTTLTMPGLLDRVFVHAFELGADRRRPHHAPV